MDSEETVPDRLERRRREEEERVRELMRRSPDPSKRSVYIYALVDPRTERIRYVGASVNPETRYKRHLGSSEHRLPSLTRWLDEMDADGVDPVMITLQETTVGDWGGHPDVQIIEQIWVRRLLAFGCDLFNESIHQGLHNLSL